MEVIFPFYALIHIIVAFYLGNCCSKLWKTINLFVSKNLSEDPLWWEHAPLFPWKSLYICKVLAKISVWTCSRKMFGTGSSIC